MNNSKIKKIILIFLGLFLAMGCEDDNSTGASTPESASIYGTITFSGDFPATGTVSVSLQSNWLPTGAPAAYSEITSLSDGTYAYLFENLSFGSYAALAVSWKDPEDDYPSTNQHVLGAHGGTAPWSEQYVLGTDPTIITVSETEFELNIDFTADFSLAVSSTGGI